MPFQAEMVGVIVEVFPELSLALSNRNPLGASAWLDDSPANAFW